MKVYFFDFAMKVHFIVICSKPIRKLIRLYTREHFYAVFIVYVSQSKSLSRQHLEEFLFRGKIIIESFVVVEMVMREVGKYSAGELYARDSALVQRVRTDFHKYIFAAFFHHFV